jgi:cell division septal protein FtsQ
VTTSRPGSPQVEQWRIVLARLPVALILAALIAAVLYLSVANEFFVYSAEILGNRYLDREKIYEASGVHEQNIFWIQPSRSADEITRLDGIKSAQIHCSLPAKVTIDIVERRPVVLWRAGDPGTDYWLDEDGVVLSYGEVLTDTVYVVESSERQLNVGDSMETEGIVQSVQQLAASLPDVSVFNYQKDRGLSFTQTTAHGSWPVYVGDSQDLLRKIQVVQSLTEYFAESKTNPAYIDVRWADYPVYGRPSGRANQASN